MTTIIKRVVVAEMVDISPLERAKIGENLLHHECAHCGETINDDIFVAGTARGGTQYPFHLGCALDDPVAVKAIADELRRVSMGKPTVEQIA